MDPIEQIREFYDNGSAQEWERMDRHPVEWHVNSSVMGRYIRPGERVLDVGGGPGRYSIHFAKKGCDVTLADLSQGNVDFAKGAAREQGVRICAVQADARDLSRFADDSFDHVLLMGPLYHLQKEEDRALAVREAVRCLKPGGVLFAAFINSYAGMMYAMSQDPASLLYPAEQEYFRLVREDKPFSGLGFTQAYFIRKEDVLPLMERFPLDRLHFLGSEAMLSACEPNILAQPPDVIAAWCDLALHFCEDERFMSLSEHFLYVGRKRF